MPITNALSVISIISSILKDYVSHATPSILVVSNAQITLTALNVNLLSFTWTLASVEAAGSSMVFVKNVLLEINAKHAFQINIILILQATFVRLVLTLWRAVSHAQMGKFVRSVWIHITYKLENV